MNKRYIFPLLFIFLLLWQCSTAPNPRKTVFDFLEAVHGSDTVAILYYVDLEKMAEEKLSDFSPEQREKLVPIMKNDLLKNLVDNGATRIQWENSLKVVAGEKILKDKAEVEVTFIDQKTGIKHYTEMKLYFGDKRWRIYYFED
jgi:hypothetical protein